MKNLFLTITALSVVIVAPFLMLTSCESDRPTADEVQAKATKASMAEASRQIGMPRITSFQQRRTLKQIQELCDSEDLICYAYLQSQLSGKLIYVGRCVGFGIPFSAQFTNPETFSRPYHGANWHSVPQPDPNGLFMPTSSSATWLLMVDEDGGDPRPVYFEPTITVSPFKLKYGLEG